MSRIRSSSCLLVLTCASLLSAANACTAKPGSEGESGQPGAVLPFASVDEGDATLSWRSDDDRNDAIPVSLTASDGTGLRLLTYKARAVIEGPLAFTELDLRFENPEDRQREGRFEINLPPGAAISRFSMKIDGRWQEAEVVERQAARRAYEDFLHRKQDPALLEKKAGNQFRARVFPIPPKGVKEIKVAYSQELRSSTEPYRVMLRGLPRLEELDVDVAIARGSSGMQSSRGGKASTVEHLRVAESAVAPRADLEVRLSAPIAEQGLRSGELVVARIKPAADIGPAPIESLTLLIDTSASRALGWSGQVERIATLVQGLSAESDFPLQVIAFDQSSEMLFEGSASSFAGAGKSALIKRRPLGASDLHGALQSLAVHHKPNARVVVLSDGIATAGETDHAKLREQVKSLGARGVQRIDAIVDGGIQDEATLRALTRGNLAQDGVSASARLSSESLQRKLRSETRSGITVDIPGATWIWPATLDGVQAGDERLVYAQLPADRDLQINLNHDGRVQGVSAPVSRAEGELLHRAATMADIERRQATLTALPREQKERRQKLKQEIVDISVAARVLSDYTALLVLETDADYARFGIDRKALVDILTVGPGGVELLNRGRKPALIAKPEPTDIPPGEVEKETPGWEDGRDKDKKQAGVANTILPSGDIDESPNEDSGLVGNGRSKGEEGRMGRPTSQREPAPDAPRRAPPAPSAVEREDSEQEESKRAEANGADGDDDVWGGLTGTEVGEAYGVGGMGLIGRGEGGGGTASGSGYGRGAGAGFGGRGRRVPRIRQGRADVRGSLDRDIIRRIVRAHLNEVRACYNTGLTQNPDLEGRVNVRFTIDKRGRVESSSIASTTLNHAGVEQCLSTAAKRWHYPTPQGGGKVIVNYPFVFSPGSGGGQALAPVAAIPELRPEEGWTGRYATVMLSLQSNNDKLALDDALAWREAEPGSELALLALGEAAEANQQWSLAARAYGSLIDLFPSRADIRRMAGERLERVATRGYDPALDLAVDTFGQAAQQRADHPSSHRLYAYALLKAGRHRDAFAAIVAGAKQSYPSGRFAGVPQILKEDVSLIASAWRAVEPKAEAEIQTRLQELGLSFDVKPSTRFVLNWETDANDVDFHIYDAKGGHAYYSDKQLRSGGSLYADVTTGYGPECFTIPGHASAGPYVLRAHYYSMGPMGYGMGKLQVIEHDGAGHLSFVENPFVIMKDHAYVGLGVHGDKAQEPGKPIPQIKDQPVPEHRPIEPIPANPGRIGQ